MSKLYPVIGIMISLVVAGGLAFWLVPIIFADVHNVQTITDLTGYLAGWTKLAVFLLSACLASFISIQFNSVLRNIEVDRQFENLRKYVDFTLLTGDQSTRYLGQLEEALDYIEEHATRAAHIYNTRVIITSRDNPQSNVDILHMDRIVDFVSRCVNNGVIWNEIISQNGMGRVSAVKKQIKAGGKYFVYKMKQEFPITNFILFEYSNEQKTRGQKNEVLFGFGYHKYDQNNEIFVSNDEKLWNFFYNFFRIYMDDHAESI
jgi:hypothetical protein